MSPRNYVVGIAGRRELQIVIIQQHLENKPIHGDNPLVSELVPQLRAERMAQAWDEGAGETEGGSPAAAGKLSLCVKRKAKVVSAIPTWGI